MSILLDYELVGKIFTKKLNGLFDTWRVVDYLGENAYLVRGQVHGYQLVVEELLRTR